MIPLMPASPATPWKSGKRLKSDSVGSPVNYRARGKWWDGIVEAVNESGRYARVRLPDGRAKVFHEFYRDGQFVWLTGNRGYSKTRLYPGTHAEWEVEWAALRAELDAKR